MSTPATPLGALAQALTRALAPLREAFRDVACAVLMLAGAADAAGTRPAVYLATIGPIARPGCRRPPTPRARPASSG